MSRCDADRASVFCLEGTGITNGGSAVVRHLDWSVRDNAVTVLFGPAGTGKSLLLRALAGMPPPQGFGYEGNWKWRGEQLWPRPNGLVAPDGIALLPQLSHQGLRAAPDVACAFSSWREALTEGRDTVLLDEPERGISAGELGQLSKALLAHRERGAAVVITHDVSFGREIADDIALLAAGRLVAKGSAEEFFEKPPSELAKRFIEQGNCWPLPEVPSLPTHFHWILPGQLAGMGQPGVTGDQDEDLSAIASAGIELLVTLTEKPFPPAKLREYGIEGQHFPIADMGVPGNGATATLCGRIERAMKAGRPVAVHCRAGMGRTGLILASELVWLGRSADEAVLEIRAIFKGFIQNDAQLRFVKQFSEAMQPSTVG